MGVSDGFSKGGAYHDGKNTEYSSHILVVSIKMGYFRPFLKDDKKYLLEKVAICKRVIAVIEEKDMSGSEAVTFALCFASFKPNYLDK